MSSLERVVHVRRSLLRLRRVVWFGLHARDDDVSLLGLSPRPALSNHHVHLGRHIHAFLPDALNRTIKRSRRALHCLRSPFRGDSLPHPILGRLLRGQESMELRALWRTLDAKTSGLPWCSGAHCGGRRVYLPSDARGRVGAERAGCDKGDDASVEGWPPDVAAVGDVECGRRVFGAG
jgi:hypothetical protein